MSRSELAHLVLADGEVFAGEAIGTPPPGGIATGEVVFNTVLTGYQEVISDPSYAGQIITFTYPHIGNYGVTSTDAESDSPPCRGVVVRDMARRPSSWRCDASLASYLLDHEIPGIAGIDTRRLTRHLRASGAVPAAFGTASLEALAAAAANEPGTSGADLVTTVSTTEPFTVAPAPMAIPNARAPWRIVAYDFGIKATILRQLSTLGSIEVVPAATAAEAVLAREPDGVFLSNGPGDPAALAPIVHEIKALLGEVPIFGICLGHQLLGAALGASTYKLRFGHHGGNHPVQRLATGAVEITAQNHNYAVAEGTVPGADVTHLNLNDGVIEGIACREIPAFGAQYHPEAGPGPHDARYLFDAFADLMQRTKSRRAS